MGLDTQKTFNQLIIMLLVGVMILIGQRVGYGIPVMNAVPGMLICMGFTYRADSVHAFYAYG